MKDALSNPSPRSEPVTPAACPTCHSPLIVTTAKIPDSASYWRCTKCGEVWNVSRSQNNGRGGYRW
jgi:predicted Zn finger-like uncharacterized protein